MLGNLQSSLSDLAYLRFYWVLLKFYNEIRRLPVPAAWGSTEGTIVLRASECRINDSGLETLNILTSVACRYCPYSSLRFPSSSCWIFVAPN